MLQLLIQLLLLACTPPPEPAPPPKPPAAAAVSFEKDVQPILEKRCQPCHFPGGKMYAKLPFDKPDTITHLGTRLFSRIKDEKEQAVITAFLKTKEPAR